MQHRARTAEAAAAPPEGACASRCRCRAAPVLMHWRRVRDILAGGTVVVLAAVMALGFWGTLFGGFVAAGMLQQAPAALAAVALLVLLRGPRALPAAAAWAMLGAAGAVLLRNVADFPAESGWIPDAVVTRSEHLCDAAWLAAIAVLSWRGIAPRLTGPLLAAVVATTRVGGYGQALVPILLEDTVRDAVLLSINLVAGFAAGVIVVMLGGWGVAMLARMPARHIAPGRALSALAVAAALGHMLHV